MTFKYTEEQRVAVESLDLSTVLTAGAGSGKTRVLVGRYVNILSKRMADVPEILAVTFTEKAAAEMNDRIRESISVLERSEEELHQREHWRRTKRKMGSAAIGTIDSLCRQIAKDYPIEAGIEPSFSIMDELDSYKRARLAARGVIEEFLESEDEVERSMTQLLTERFGLGKLVSELVALHEKVRVTGDTADGVAFRFITRDYGLSTEEIARCRDDESLKMSNRIVASHFLNMCKNMERRYYKLGGNGSQLDFVELELAARRVLLNPVYGDIYRRRYKFVMVDEYQDVNELQDDIIRLLTQDRFASKLFVVGDPKQSIYRFRGGNLELFRRMSREVKKAGGLSEELTLNFRSRHELIRFTNEVFSHVLGDDFRDARWNDSDSEKDRTRAKMAVIVSNENGEKRAVCQAEFVAKRIAQMVKGAEPIIDDASCDDGFRAVRYGDIAILMRGMTNVKAYEEALSKEGVPYHVVSGSGFYERSEVMWLSGILTSLADESDDTAVVGALRSPIFTIDDETLTRTFLEFGRGEGFWDALLGFRSAYEEGNLRWPDGELATRLYRAVDTMLRLRYLTTRVTPLALTEAVVKTTGFERKLLAMPEGVDMALNLHKLLGIMAERESKLSSIYDVVAFLDDMSTGGSREEELSVDDVSEDVVKIMTVHKSKGLEFPVVFVPECFNEVGKARQALTFDSQLGLRVKLGDLVEDDERSSQICDVDAKNEVEEHGRCLYVALTRAEKYLVIVGSLKCAKAKKQKKDEDVEEKVSWGRWVLKPFGIECDETLCNGEVCQRRLLESNGARLELRVYDISEYPSEAADAVFEDLDVDVNSGACASFEDDTHSISQRGRFHILDSGTCSGECEVHMPVTALVDYSRCPRKYVYSYVEYIKPENLPSRYSNGIKAKERLALSANVRGTIVHSVCSKLSDVTEARHLVELELGKFGVKGERLFQEAEKVMPLVEAYMRNYVYGPEDTSLKEVPFMFKVGRFILSGKVDRLELCDDVANIFDFKTDDVLDFKVDSNAMMYEAQVKAYSVAVWRNYRPQKVMTRLHFLKPDKCSDMEFVEKDISNAERFILDALEGVDSASMANTEIRKCDYCKECAYSVLCDI